MCGIVGYVGSEPALPYLIEGLKRLEYRGYDSAGVAIAHQGKVTIRKAVGKVSSLVKKIGNETIEGGTGIAHTRWATHGEANEINCHPHYDPEQKVILAHNGTIENYHALKESLPHAQFASATDTEVIAHLIAEETKEWGDSWWLANKAIHTTVQKLNGSYALVIVFKNRPDVLFAIRHKSPLVVGRQGNECVVSSDINGLINCTEYAILPEDTLFQISSGFIQQETEHSIENWSPHWEEIKNYTASTDRPHGQFFMEDEIYSQPTIVKKLIERHGDPENGSAYFDRIGRYERITLTGCGTSYYATMLGSQFLQKIARLPASVEYASELRYANIVPQPNELVIALSQSGETADTLGAMKELQRRGLPILVLCNVETSAMAQKADHFIDLCAGPEKGVASTKAFTAQTTLLFLLSLYWGRMRHTSSEEGNKLLEQLTLIPKIMQQTLTLHEKIKEIAKKYKKYRNILYLGREVNYPIALEGALKLTEISYIHAQGFSAAEIKHGPIALVDEDTPSVIINTAGPRYDKVMNNVQEIRARKGPVIAIASEGDQTIQREVNDTLYVPSVPDLFSPFVTIIVMQLLAYEIALQKGNDVDKPRNLAKSVTVE